MKPTSRITGITVAVIAALSFPLGVASSASAEALSAGEALAATGFSSAPWLIAAGVLLLLGLALFVVNLLRRRAERVESEKLAQAASETPGNTGLDNSISPDGS